jgi:hypothetical protein
MRRAILPSLPREYNAVSLRFRKLKLSGEIAKMLKLKTIFCVVSMTLLLFAAADAQMAAFTYQGKLADNSNPAGGIYDMTFVLFDAVTAGNQLGSVLVSNVTVANGIFTVNLDFGANAFASGANRFLEIRIKRTADPTFSTLSPRQPLTSAPFAIRSLSAAVSDGLSASCVTCVNDAQLLSIAGAKVTGNVASATTANTATTAVNVSGVVAIANGGTGSATKNFVDLNTPQTIAGAKTFTANLRETGLMRTGSETGTSEAPVIDPGIDSYSGLITRRINSTSNTAGLVVARTNILRLERDGTDGGWQISYPALGTGLEISQSIHCIGINNLGAVVPARIQLSANTAGTTPLYTNAQNVEYMQCTLGNNFNAGHQTQVTLQRFTGDFFWIGTSVSTFNQ